MRTYSKPVTIYILTVIFSATTVFCPIPANVKNLAMEKYAGMFPWITPEIFYSVEIAAKTFEVSVEEMLSIIHSESNGNKFAVSSASARGLCQIMPFHHRGNPNDLFDVGRNIYYGARYFRWCKNFSNGNLRRALIAYNAGPFFPVQHYRKSLERYYVNTIISNISKAKRLPDPVIIIK